MMACPIPTVIEPGPDSCLMLHSASTSFIGPGQSQGVLRDVWLGDSEQ